MSAATRDLTIYSLRISANQVWDVNAGRTFTAGLGSSLSGAFSLTKEGDGTAILSSANAYTGGTTVNAGTLSLGTGGATGAIRGTLTVDSGASVAYTANNSFGYTSGQSVNVLNINGGTVGSAGYGNHFWNSFQLNMTGGTLNLGYSAGQTFNEFQNPTITVNSSANQAQILAAHASANLRLRDGTSGTFNVADGAQAVDLLVTAPIVYNTSGSGIIKTGAGTMQLNGINTYNGNTTVNGGTLVVGAGAKIYSGAYQGSAVLTVNSGSTVDLQNWGYAESAGTTMSLGGLRNNNNAIVISGGTIRISGGTATSYDRGVTVNAAGATFEAATGATWTMTAGSIANVYNSNPSLTFTGAGTGTMEKAFSGAGALTKSGTGTWSFSGANTYTGTTTISAGTMAITGGGRLNNGAYAGAISNAGTFLYNSTANQTLSGVVSGAGALVKSNSGTLTLSGSSGGFTGPVTIRSGTLQVSSTTGAGTNTITLGDGSTGASSTTLNVGANFANAIVVAAGPSGAAAINAAVGTPIITGSLTVNRPLSIGGGSDRFTWTGAGANWSGSGDITITSNRVTHDTASGNTWSGNMTINNGATFQPGHATTLRSVNSVTANGTLQLNNVAQTINGLSGSGFVQNIVGSNTLTVGAGDASSTFSGVIRNNVGTFSLAKSGTGTQTLTGTNTYTGSTTINAGTLEIGGGGSLGSGAYAGNITNNGTLSVNSTANQTLSGNMTGNGALVKDNTGILTLSTPKSYTGLTTVSGGTLTVNGTGTLSGTTGLSVASGATFNYVPSTIGTMTMNAGSTLSFATGSILGLNWDASTSSRIAALGAATMGSGVKVSMTGAYTSGTTYTILTAASGLDSGSYTAINNVDYTAAFVQSPTSVTITPTTAAPLSAAYWKGGTSGYESVMGVASNWTTDGAGLNPSALTPGAAANVTFSASGAASGNQVNMTMGADMALNSLTLNGTSGSPVNTNTVSLSPTGGYTLTLGSTAGAGITMNTGAGALTLNPPLVLGTSQTWTNNSSNPLVVNGTVSNGANNLTVTGTGNTTLSGAFGGGAGGITKNGTGGLTLGAANSYTGATVINAGRVTLGNSSGFGTSSGVTIGSGAALNVAGFSTSRPITVSGTGDGSIAAIYNSSTGSASALGALTLAGNARMSSASLVNGFTYTSLDLAGNTLTLDSGRITNGSASITAGNILLTNGSVWRQSGTPASTTHTMTLAGGSIYEFRDMINTGVASVTAITLDGGTISNGGIYNNANGNGGGTTYQTMKNDLTLAGGGGTLYGNNTAFGGTFQYYTQFSGSLNGSGTLATSGGKGVTLMGDTSAFTGDIVNTTNLRFSRTAGQAIAGDITSSGSIYVSPGTLDLNGNVTMTGGSGFFTQEGVGTATVNIAAGTLFTHNGTGNLIIGQNTASHNGILNVAGTYVQNAGSAMFGNNQPGATGTLNINSGGTVTFGAGMANTGTSGGSGQVGIILGRDNATAAGTFNLNTGGTLESAKGMVRGTGAGYFNFDGGTLRALASLPSFIDVTTTTVNSGGAVIDSNGYDIGIVDGLTAGTGSGGLTKNGGGTLTLQGVNTYTGATAVNNGTLTVSGAGSLNNTSSLSLAAGTQFNYLPTVVNSTATVGSTLALGNNSTVGLAWNATHSSHLSVSGAATVGSNVGFELTGTPAAIEYTLLTAASGLNTTYTVRNNYNYYVAPGDWNISSTFVKMTPTPVAALTTAYWTGGLSGSENVWAASNGSSASNWAATDGAAVQVLIPGSGADVIVSNSALTTAPTSTTLGANMSVNSLTISDTTNGLGLNADGYTLTVGTGGIAMTSGVPSSTLAAKVALGANQTWTNDSASPLTVSGVISGTSTLAKAGTGNVRVTAADNTFTGGITVSAGTFEVGGAGRLNLGAYAGAIANAGTLFINSTANQSLSGALSGAGTLAKDGAGALTITNAGGMTGPMLINGGTVQVTGGNIRAISSITVGSGGTLSLGATNLFTTDHGTAESPSFHVTLNGGSWVSTSGVSRIGNVNLNSGATWSVNVTDSTWGNYYLGALSDSSQASITVGGSSASVINGSGNLKLGANTIFDIGDATSSAAVDLTVTALLQNQASSNGLGGLTKTGLGTLLLGGNSTYEGATTINQGVVAVSGGNGIGDASDVVLSTTDATATLRLDASEAVNSIAGGSATAGGISLQGNTLQIGRQVGNATTTYDGIISGTGGLVRRGAGTTTLTGANTFTGSVLVQDTGAISVPSIDNIGVAQPLGAGTSPIQLQGGTLAITGAGTYTTDRGLQLVSPSNESGVLSVAGTLNMSGDITGGSSGTTFTKAGAGTFNFSGTGSWSGNFNLTGGVFELSGAGSIPDTGVTTLSGGASLKINTSGVVQTIRITAATGTTVNLEAGTLRVAGGDLGGSPVYSIDNTGSFTWGTGTTMAVFGGKTSGQTDRTALSGAASGPAIKEGNYLFVKNDLTQPAGSTLDLGGLFGSSDALRYNQIHVAGSLTIDDGASLKLDLNPYYLRPYAANERFTGDWGTLVLAYASGGISGDYDFANVLGITSDQIGWTRLADQTDSFFDPASLDLDTYLIEYRTGAGAGFNFVQAGGAILLHYKVSGSVPEPASAGMVIAGALLLRVLRRRSA